MADETKVETKPPETPDEFKDVLARLMKKFDEPPDSVAVRLIKQNVDLGSKLAAAEARATAAEDKAKQAALPADHVAVPKADADLLAEYRTLGAPKDVKASLDRLPVLDREIATRKRDDELAAVASAVGYVPAVLKRLVPEGVAFEPHKEKGRFGQEVETFLVVDTGPDGKERKRPLAEVESSDWKEMLPALRPDGRAAGGEPRRDQAAPANRPVGGSPYRGSANLNGDSGRDSVPPAERENTIAAARIAIGI